MMRSQLVGVVVPFIIRVSMRKKMASTYRSNAINYKLKGPKSVLVILVDWDIEVRLDTNKLSIILSFHLYLTYLYWV